MCFLSLSVGCFCKFFCLCVTRCFFSVYQWDFSSPCQCVFSLSLSLSVRVFVFSLSVVFSLSFSLSVRFFSLFVSRVFFSVSIEFCSFCLCQEVFFSSLSPSLSVCFFDSLSLSVGSVLFRHWFFFFFTTSFVLLFTTNFHSFHHFFLLFTTSFSSVRHCFFLNR